MDTENVPPRKTLLELFVGAAGLLVIINLLYLDYYLYSQTKSTVSSVASPMATAQPIEQSASCDEDCVRAIVKEATGSIALATAAPTPRAATQSLPKQIATAAPVTSREFFVSIGSGQTAAGDWSDVTNLQTNFSVGQYSNIKSIYFEAKISVPSSTGIGYARLFNVSDNIVVANSDINSANSSPQLITSLPLQLEGSKLYKVQMKSSQQKDVVIADARIKIVTN